MRSGADGLMLIIDASVLADVVTDNERADDLRRRMAADPVWASPHLVDAEVLAVVERHLRCGLLDRAFELRENIRAYDALYVALAEALGATLLTLDHRLVSASEGPVHRKVELADIDP